MTALKDIKIELSPEVLEDFRRIGEQINNSSAQVFAAMLPTFDETMQQMRRAFDRIGYSIEAFHNFKLRRPHEHPLDWIERVGAGVSGYNITPGERWRFETLRDWWTPDDVLDEYGVDYPVSKDLWS